MVDDDGDGSGGYNLDRAERPSLNRKSGPQGMLRAAPEGALGLPLLQWDTGT